MDKRSMFLLFSHQLTEVQLQDARKNLAVGNFVSLPLELQQRWSEVPPDLPSLLSWLRPVWKWLMEQSQPGDWVLIQGEQGLVYHTVAFCKLWLLRPVYATSKRQVIAENMSNGKIVIHKVFKHHSFRLYEQATDPLSFGTPSVRSGH